MQLRAVADPSRVPTLQRFFRTGKGEYAEGDRFIGITVPQIRAICRECRGTSLSGDWTVAALARSRRQNDRAPAARGCVHAGRRRTQAGELRLLSGQHLPCEQLGPRRLVGAADRRRLAARSEQAPLTRLARSAMLWERRIAIVATHDFIRLRKLDETFRIADLLIEDRHDLIHKASGWMLREAGKRDEAGAARLPR